MGTNMATPGLEIRPAGRDDVSLILSLIRELAEYEHLPHEVTATEAVLEESLFGSRQVAETLIGEYEGEAAGFALFFHNFSTFLGREFLVHLARSARERDCGRMEWWVLNWNEPAQRFYRNLGAIPMDDWTSGVLPAIASISWRTG